MSANEILKLAADLSMAGPKMVGPMRAVFKEAGDQTAREWAAIATGTSGVSGRDYPKSITAELTFSTNLTVEVGPDASKPQGSMGRGFEFGSVNQPPHLDGVKAVTKMEPVIEKMARSALDGLIP